MYLNVNFNAYFKLIKVLLLVSELYILSLVCLGIFSVLSELIFCLISSCHTYFNMCWMVQCHRAMVDMGYFPVHTF